MYRINIILSLRKENIYELISICFALRDYYLWLSKMTLSTKAASMMNINNIFYILKLLIA